MIEKIIIFFLLIKFSQTILYAIIDQINKSGEMFQHVVINTYNCGSVNEDNFIFRGRFPNILDILDKEKITDFNNTKIEGYKFVYFPENSLYEKYADIFPSSTIFVKSESSDKKKNCFILLNLNNYERNIFREKSVPYYLSINKKTLKTSIYDYDIIDFCFCYLIPLFVILFCRYFCMLCKCNILYFNLQFYVFTRRLILLCIPLIVSNLLMKYALFIALFHSLYKSYILINLIFLLDGNSILEFENVTILYIIYLLICFIIEASLSLLIDYIVYYFPSVNNLYYDAIKNLVEHIALLIYTLKSYNTKYYHFYNQYLFEIRLKSLLSSFYLYKIEIYQKVIKFAFFYSFVFIGFQIFKIIFLSDFADAFYCNYFINIWIEMILVFILMKMFYPQNLNMFYFMPVFYDYNSKAYKVLISKEENKLNISNLNKNILKNEYKKNKTPLVFITPFSKSNEDFYNIHIAEIA